jgi:LPXTG-motif cell wall-anchored protein
VVARIRHSDAERSRGAELMTQSTVQIVAGVLAVVLIGIVFLRRKNKKTKSEDEEF